ncbi:MAG: nucleotidyltransferase domain-containing protein [Alistipes sp.]|nr:nucleotidyltransferase domain-containing protein [Alistipes sp.]
MDNDTIARINNVFASFPKIEKAIIYGSRAKGSNSHSSDIDLTLYGRDLTLEDLPLIEWALDDLLLPYKIDLSIYDRISNADLKDHIDRRGVLFYMA